MNRSSPRAQCGAQAIVPCMRVAVMAVACALFLGSAPASGEATETDGEETDPSVELLRDRLLEAVRRRKDVSAVVYVPVLEAKQKAKVLGVRDDMLRVRVEGIETARSLTLSVPATTIDESDLVTAVYPHIAEDDGQANLAMLTICVRVQRPAGVRALLARLKEQGNVSLIAQAERIIAARSKLVAQRAAESEAKRNKEAKARAAARAEVHAARKKALIHDTSTPDPEPKADPMKRVVPKKGRVFYVDGTNGKDGRAGSERSPWKTLQRAAEKLRPGDTVVMRKGLYILDNPVFQPAGISPNVMTTFMAAPGERVLLNGKDGYGPAISVGRYVRLEGLWIGGTTAYLDDDPDPTTYGFAVGTQGAEFIGCTFFGLQISQGSSEGVVYQRNRFVNCGLGRFTHGIYLQGGYTKGQMGQHAIVDNNKFIGGQGYAVHGWHDNMSNIITRNFIAGSYWGLVMDGTDHLIANNFYWKMKGQLGREGPWGAWLPGERIMYFNNIHGPRGSLMGSDGKLSRLSNNAFLHSSPKGEDTVTLRGKKERTQLGISAKDLDKTIAELERIFAQPAKAIFADTTTEGLFAGLDITLKSSSPLHGEGIHWFSEDKKAKMKRIVVTGAKGGIGPSIVREYAHDFDHHM